MTQGDLPSCGWTVASFIPDARLGKLAKLASEGKEVKAAANEGLFGDYANFYGGSDGGVMANVNNGVLSLAIEKGPTTPRGAQMFDDAINHFGAENLNAIEGKWVRAMPSNLNTFNEMVRGGMSPEQAAGSTFTGKMAARHGFGNVQVTKAVGEPGAYTDVQVLFTR
ncbi:hypothetical protein [Streptomyces sp. NRRL F-5126]|uniref:hypothetical protein n=1 Tax=Streptomyces sp. NRRL F-5126 TaxID=1463857 RepID=UPI00131E05B2|nr:hypothetical protein [Streptomyces sp. NRRL F-5126]